MFSKTGNSKQFKKPKLNHPFRLRFAPSPTGFLHIGSARTALFNYLFAKANQGKFILRIEDTDVERSTKFYLEDILQSLQWLGINWEEGPGLGGDYGPYEQSKRKEIYKKYLDLLIKKKKVYPCFSTESELAEKKKQARANNEAYIYDEKYRNASEEEVRKKIQSGLPYVYRFFNPKKVIVLADEVKGQVKFETKLLGDFIVTKSNGNTTYNFANVVDDIEMKITHIIRGDDHLTNTFKQILLYEALEFDYPTYAHISLIYGENKEKLSKRHGATSILEFKEQGYFPGAIVNYLALLGWSPPNQKEVINQSELENSFTKLAFSKSPAIFDYKKLDYFNGLYLRNLASEEVIKIFKEKLRKQKLDLSHPKLDEILLAFKNQCKKINDIIPLYNNFINQKIVVGEADKSWIINEKSLLLFKMVKNFLLKKSDEFITKKEFKEIISLARQENIKGKNFFMPLRIKLTGYSSGLELADLITLKTRKEILSQLSENS